MLRANLAIGTRHRAFQKAPDVFNRVCVNIATYVFLASMADRFVPGVMIRDIYIWRPIIRDDKFGLGVRVPFNKGVQGFPVCALDRTHSDIAATLNDAGHNGFVALGAAPDASDVSLLAAN